MAESQVDWINVGLKGVYRFELEDMGVAVLESDTVGVVGGGWTFLRDSTGCLFGSRDSAWLEDSRVSLVSHVALWFEYKVKFLLLNLVWYII